MRWWRLVDTARVLRPSAGFPLRSLYEHRKRPDHTLAVRRITGVQAVPTPHRSIADHQAQPLVLRHRRLCAGYCVSTIQRICPGMHVQHRCVIIYSNLPSQEVIMSMRIGTTSRALLMVSMLVLALIAGTRTLSAQVAWPCATITVTNNHPVAQIVVQFVTTPPGSIPPIGAAPGASVIAGVPPGTTINGIISAGGFFYPFVPPPGAPPCGAGSWMVSHVTMPPNNGCFDLCLDPATCTLTCWQSKTPPACNP